MGKHPRHEGLQSQDKWYPDTCNFDPVALVSTYACTYKFKVVHGLVNTFTKYGYMQSHTKDMREKE